MADHLEEHFSPIICEGKDYGNLMYRYLDSGVWKLFPEAALGKFIRDLLDTEARPNRIDHAIKLLQHQVYKSPSELEGNPMFLNLRNGMFGVREMKLYDHDPKYHSRVQLPIECDEKATCPTWIAGLEKTFADDEAKIEVLQQFAGYCLYPKILFPCALFQIGRGKNGKGTVQEVIQAMLGEDNVCHISLTRMEDKFGPVELCNKLLNSCGETAAKPLDPTRFKEIAAGDVVQSEVKYKPDVVFTPIAKHLISMNEFPGVKDKTDAFYRRIIVLEYQQSFEGEDEIVRLADQIIADELNGVFMWALEGLKLVLSNQAILTPESVERGKKRFRASSNPVLSFVEEACIVGAANDSGAPSKVSPPVLFRAYKAWCEDGAVPKNMRMGKLKFYEQILTNYRGIEKKRDPGGSKDVYIGIGLRDNLDFDFDE